MQFHHAFVPQRARSYAPPSLGLVSSDQEVKAVLSTQHAVVASVLYFHVIVQSSRLCGTHEP
jgi:phage gp46-like protein